MYFLVELFAELVDEMTYPYSHKRGKWERIREGFKNEKETEELVICRGKNEEKSSPWFKGRIREEKEEDVVILKGGLSRMDNMNTKEQWKREKKKAVEETKWKGQDGGVTCCVLYEQSVWLCVSAMRVKVDKLLMSSGDI